MKRKIFDFPTEAKLPRPLKACRRASNGHESNAGWEDQPLKKRPVWGAERLVRIRLRILPRIQNLPGSTINRRLGIDAI